MGLENRPNLNGLNDDMTLIEGIYVFYDLKIYP